MNEIDTNELKAHAPLIPYIQQFYSDKIHIEKISNGTAFARCLWHQENTPSLAFFANGTYKCFGGCGAHGDIITLVQSLEKVSFEEACKIIGDNVGYEIVLEEPNPAWEAYKDELDNHTRRYWNLLQNSPDALNYIMNVRGISPEMIDKFRLGLTAQDEYRYRTDIGNISNRIVFPILEHKRKKPKCVGMAYRGFTDEKPKYINDANQEGRDNQNPNLAGVFIKGNMLYGLHQAYEGIKRCSYVILTEGYFDVIALHQTGITNAVCTMGTSITQAQIEALSKLTKNVMLIYDSDKAGIEGMVRCIKALYVAKFNVVVCVLEGGQDPADLCKSQNFDYLSVSNAIKQHTQQSVDFILNKVLLDYESVVTKERIKALQLGLPILELIADPAIKKIFEAQLYKRLGI